MLRQNPEQDRGCGDEENCRKISRSERVFFFLRVMSDTTKGEKCRQRQNKRRFWRCFVLLRFPPSVVRCARTRAPVCVCMYAHTRKHALFMFNINIFFVVGGLSLSLFSSLFLFFFFLYLFLSSFLWGVGDFLSSCFLFFFLAFSLFLILFFFLFLCVSNSFFFNYLKINMIQNFSFKNTKIRKSRNVNAFHKALKCR